MQNQQKRWNIFARELETILAAHGQHLTSLDPRLGIAEEKARRLQKSLLTAGEFPVLSPDELESLEIMLPLMSEEWARLRAALLATDVERMLLYRIGQDKALLVAEQIVSQIAEALREQLQLSDTKRVPADGEPRENTQRDRAWEDIWHALNSASQALQASCYVSSSRERMKELKKAQADFQEALDALNRLDEGTKSLPLWQNCVEEARQGLNSAIERLEEV